MNLLARPRSGTVVKLLGIVLLVALLQIPLWFINDLRAERARHRDAALAEITASWGGVQQLTGPFLVVPVRTVSTRTRETMVNGRAVFTTEQRPVEQLAVFLPERLAIDGDIEPERRHRGIYEAVVYRARLRLSGRFAAPDLAALGATAADLAWDRAWLALGVNDLRGAREAIVIDWNGRPLACEPGSRHPLLPAGVHAPLPGLDPSAAPGEFSLELTLNGGGRLAFVPVGRQTDVALRSPWADPSFTGPLLPARREIGPEGFTAAWQSSYYGADFPRQWIGDESGAPTSSLAFTAAAFGVELVELVDPYRIVERATKYGMLFITLLFTAFFLFEVLAALRLHVLHYGLVGAALVLFYLALLSLSEFTPFLTAYVSAALASTLLISLYSHAILRGGRRSLIIGAALTGIYGFLFLVLQLQDYALLAGTAALFAVLGLVMFTTRKIDWSHATPQPPPMPMPEPAE